MEENPPTKHEPSAEAEHAPEPHRVEPAPIVAIAGVRVVRWADVKDAAPVYQRLRGGRMWEGPFMINVTRIAIEDSGADPLYVAAYVIRHLPPPLRADCTKADCDPIEVGQAIASLLVDDGKPKGKRWRNPESVPNAILRALHHPRPDNVTRGHEVDWNDPWPIPKHLR